MAAVVIIIICVLVIIGLTYRGLGAYLRDRQRGRGGGDRN